MTSPPAAARLGCADGVVELDRGGDRAQHGVELEERLVDSISARVEGRDLRETGPLSQMVQAGGKALRIRHINDMEVCKKRPRVFK
jgi:hypothetical protein